jgi:segregation and condensation protein A
MNATDEYHFRIGSFEGPLDLLLFLIRKSEVSIYDIPISEITEQYLQYLKFATGINLDNITDFYVMAATLLHIKSQMLLPVEVDLEDEASDPRKDLVERLIEHQKFKVISEMISEKGKEAEWVVERSKKQRILPFSDDDSMWDRVDVWELLKTFSNLMSTLSAERIIDLYEEVSINEKLTLIAELLENRGEFYFVDLITNPRSMMEIVCAFLALLESVKTRRISVYQNRLFGDIRISTREAATPA